MKLSCIIPAHNESECIEKVINELTTELERSQIKYEIIVVNDNSTDNSRIILDRLRGQNNGLIIIHRDQEPGFGRAVKAGLSSASGDALCIVMGDHSDDPQDVVKMFRKIEQGYDVVYGSRFIKGAKVYDYPTLKLILNRIANHFVKIIFLMGNESDITNAFKMYKREVIRAIGPIESNAFNITLELPLKAELKKFKRTSVPAQWYGRQSDVSKFSI